MYKAFKIEEAHTSVLQSWIIKILKDNLVYDYNNIRKDVNKMLENKFKIDDKEFNSALEKLLEKGFCSWDDFEHYQYID